MSDFQSMPTDEPSLVMSLLVYLKMAAENFKDNPAHAEWFLRCAQWVESKSQNSNIIQ